MICPVFLSNISAARRNSFAPRWPRTDDRRGVRSVGQAAAPSVGASGLDQLAIRVVARQTPGAMEHGQGPIRIRVDPDQDLHIMEAVRVLGDLQAHALIPHGIVVGHDAVFLDTE